ncbi:galactosyldiacylglycerol synthase [Aquincola sp. S2]|uniref:Galactosyldiacylglycerol synthase n=1 Tax=Pseudaquabacterium terrae TaxID=2732868 RepID=A0ABX2EJZ9_9BURK|nr:galactosyldiacylglycerol synthase [Aquabacterium terrae]NRF68905.1 galactosyldiacylglycerol synthase [Aquabacterium terrae]
MQTVALIYCNAGGGHRAAAQALQAAIQEEGRPWRVELVNLFEVLDPQSRLRKLTGLAPEDFYNQRLKRGWTLGMAQELKLLQGLIRLSHASLLKTLQQHWAATEPDLVVSLVPNFNRVLQRSVASSLPGVPFVTVMTDLADLPPSFWVDPGLQQHIVCGTPRALEQARAQGYPDEQLSLVSGMMLRPDFHRPPLEPAARAVLRLGHGLPAEAPVGVVSFGGQGSQVMVNIARQLPALPLILMCGHNERLAERLRRLPAEAPRLVLGFTPEVPRVLALGDFFIGKPGPGSLSEAVQMGLPVLTVRNAWTMPQERFNTEWVRELGIGHVLPGFRRMQPAVQALLDELPELKTRVGRVRNRAVYEVTALLARQLADAQDERPPMHTLDLLEAR